jgi:hypothetical protein
VGREHWADVREALDAHTYRPSPVRRVVTPKPAGRGERLLGVPTCLDRLIQRFWTPAEALVAHHKGESGPGARGTAEGPCSLPELFGPAGLGPRHREL